MKEQPLPIPEIYAGGKENLEKMVVKREVPLDNSYGTSVMANRKCLDALFFVTKFFADAEKAVQLGASAIVVSNHGRSSVDFSLPSMMALPEIVGSVGDKLTVLQVPLLWDNLAL